MIRSQNRPLSYNNTRTHTTHTQHTHTHNTCPNKDYTAAKHAYGSGPNRARRPPCLWRRVGFLRSSSKWVVLCRGGQCLRTHHDRGTFTPARAGSAEVQREPVLSSPHLGKRFGTPAPTTQPLEHAQAVALQAKKDKNDDKATNNDGTIAISQPDNEARANRRAGLCPMCLQLFGTLICIMPIVGAPIFVLVGLMFSAATSLEGNGADLFTVAKIAGVSTIGAVSLCECWASCRKYKQERRCSQVCNGYGNLFPDAARNCTIVESRWRLVGATISPLPRTVCAVSGWSLACCLSCAFSSWCWREYIGAGGGRGKTAVCQPPSWQ